MRRLFSFTKRAPAEAAVPSPPAAGGVWQTQQQYPTPEELTAMMAGGLYEFDAMIGTGGMAAVYRGRQPKHSPSDVSHGITSQILWSTLYVLVVHFAFAFYEFDPQS